MDHRGVPPVSRGRSLGSDRYEKPAYREARCPIDLFYRLRLAEDLQPESTLKSDLDYRLKVVVLLEQVPIVKAAEAGCRSELPPPVIARLELHAIAGEVIRAYGQCDARGNFERLGQEFVPRKPIDLRPVARLELAARTGPMMTLRGDV
jgi:hypothetical protein